MQTLRKLLVVLSLVLGLWGGVWHPAIADPALDTSEVELLAPTAPPVYGTAANIALQKQQAAARGETLYTGDERKIGNGYVRVWVTHNAEGHPTRIGVTLTEGGLYNLPDDGDTGRENGQEAAALKLMDMIGHDTFEYELLFPPEAAETAYTHMGFNWNPFGHAPQNVFTEGHYDVHFYMESPEYRHNIAKVSAATVLQGHKKPPSGYMPANYQMAYGTLEPRMGIHWADFQSPQLKPGKFENIFLFGSHNGRVLFWEPMITRDYLLKKVEYRETLSQPKYYPSSKYYPLTYTLHYDQERHEFDIVLDDLVYRPGTPVVAAS
ncbi:MAG: DUF5602 domain-containing protein [Oscillatoriales cyanobacterium SM2_1_8]|nr:DUF5602 domain-containing protein [Oscillatoriales cyanobacterium SM2_1_8]